MRYLSTRNNKAETSWSQAIIQGISKDGGLFVPEIFPKIEDLEKMKDMDYKEVAYQIMEKFFPELGGELLRNIIDKGYDRKFSKVEIAPLSEIGDVFFLELFHGPTLAFKDMALSILPHLLKSAMDIENTPKDIVILTATSGDTGKAALEGFANVENIKIIVFYPENGVSEIQKKQMLTQKGKNTFVVGIKGNFDDAQSGVKALFNDKDFVNNLDKMGYILSSANSINIGRLIPQIVYYFHSYLTLLKQEKIVKGEKINIVVPTGNFGNILAAYYGKQMGLPVNKLICASNENNVLYDFLRTGVYDKRRNLVLTSSPSMDILVSSNLERLLYHLSGEDHKLVDSKMKELSGEGFYELKNSSLKDFYGGFSREEEVKESIAAVFKENDYLMDPHTAVAYNVYKRYRLETKDTSKTIIASTASPFKFGTTVASALGLETIGKDEFQILEELEKETNTTIPKPIKDLKGKPLVHNNNCDKEKMKSMVEKFLKAGEIDD